MRFITVAYLDHIWLPSLSFPLFIVSFSSQLCDFRHTSPFISFVSCYIIIPDFSCTPGLSCALRPQKTNRSVCYHQINAHKQLKNPQCCFTYKTPWHSIWDRLDLPNLLFQLQHHQLFLRCIYTSAKLHYLLFIFQICRTAFPFHAAASEVPLAGLESPTGIFLKLRPYPLFNPTLNSCSSICCMNEPTLQIIF